MHLKGPVFLHKGWRTCSVLVSILGDVKCLWLHFETFVILLWCAFHFHGNYRTFCRADSSTWWNDVKLRPHCVKVHVRAVFTPSVPWNPTADTAIYLEQNELQLPCLYTHYPFTVIVDVFVYHSQIVTATISPCVMAIGTCLSAMEDTAESQLEINGTSAVTLVTLMWLACP